MPLKPESVSLPSATGGPNLLPRDKNPGRSPFVFVFYPGNWTFDDATGEFLPELREQQISPGVGGTDKAGNPRLLYASLVARGCIILDPQDSLIDLGPHGDYLKMLRNDGGVAVHHTKFERVELIGDAAYWEEGGTRYDEFRRYVRDNVVKRTIPDPIKRRMVDRESERLERRKGRLNQRPNDLALRADIETRHARLVAMQRGIPLDEARQTVAEAAAPTPPKRRSPRKKAAAEGAAA